MCGRGSEEISGEENGRVFPDRGRNGTWFGNRRTADRLDAQWEAVGVGKNIQCTSGRGDERDRGIWGNGQGCRTGAHSAHSGRRNFRSGLRSDPYAGSLKG